MSPLYVALGDSMSIDVYAGGLGRGAASLLHRNRDADFPDWTGRDLYTRGFEILDLAVDGALTADVLERQLPRLDRPADVVTMTMGGNDLMMTFGDTRSAEAVIEHVAATGDEILRRLRAVVAGDAAIVLTTVYDPSDGSGAVPGGALPPWPDGPRLIRDLNAALARLAERHGAVLADVHAHFFGHGAAVGDPGQPHPQPADRELWFCGVIEPNAWGAHEIRRTWWQALESAGRLG